MLFNDLRQYDGAPAPITQLGVSELEAAGGAGAVRAEPEPESVTRSVGGAGHLAPAQVTVLKCAFIICFFGFYFSQVDMEQNIFNLPRFRRLLF